VAGHCSGLFPLDISERSEAQTTTLLKILARLAEILVKFHAAFLHILLGLWVVGIFEMFRRITRWFLWSMPILLRYLCAHRVIMRFFSIRRDSCEVAGHFLWNAFRKFSYERISMIAAADWGFWGMPVGSWGFLSDSIRICWKWNWVVAEPDAPSVGTGDVRRGGGWKEELASPYPRRRRRRIGGGG